MNANKPTRSVFKGDITFGTFSLPVAVYKSQEPIGMPGKLFHEGCGGKVVSPNKCEEHPDLEYPPTYSAVQVEDGSWRKLDRQTRNFLLGRESDVIQIVSSHKLSDIAGLISSDRFVACGYYEIQPQKLNRRISLTNAQIWETFLSRLQVKKRFLMVKAPIGGLERYGALFGNGRFMTLLNDEEIREQQGNEGGSVDSLIGKQVDQMLTALDSPFPVLSCAHIIQAMEEFVKVELKPGKIAAKKPNVNKLLADLETAVVEAKQRKVSQ